jgi:hypothetical protein
LGGAAAAEISEFGAALGTNRRENKAVQNGRDARPASSRRYEPIK